MHHSSARGSPQKPVHEPLRFAIRKGVDYKTPHGMITSYFAAETIGEPLRDRVPRPLFKLGVATIMHAELTYRM
jgi:hypothetical protein